jgi:hypothetical protein
MPQFLVNLWHQPLEQGLLVVPSYGRQSKNLLIPLILKPKAPHRCHAVGKNALETCKAFWVQHRLKMLMLTDILSSMLTKCIKFLPDIRNLYHLNTVVYSNTVQATWAAWSVRYNNTWSAASSDRHYGTLHWVGQQLFHSRLSRPVNKQ